LPDDLRHKKVRLSLPGLGDDEFLSEQDLEEFFSSVRLGLSTIRHIKKRGHDLKREMADNARMDRMQTKILDDFRAGLATIEAAHEASVYEALDREAAALEEQAGRLHEQICDTPASSFDSLLWQLELARDYCDNPDLLDTIIGGVKGLAGPNYELGLDELMKAERKPLATDQGLAPEGRRGAELDVIGFGEPEQRL
jgi:hypothetical protein